MTLLSRLVLVLGLVHGQLAAYHDADPSTHHVLVPVPIANISSLPAQTGRRGFHHPCWDPARGQPDTCAASPPARSDGTAGAARCAVPRGGGAGVVVIGGVGDSGTRAVHALMHEHFGMDTCLASKFRMFNTATHDSAVFKARLVMRRPFFLLLSAALRGGGQCKTVCRAVAFHLFRTLFASFS